MLRKCFHLGPAVVVLAHLDSVMSKSGAVSSEQVYIASGGKLDGMKCDILVHPVPVSATQEIDESHNLAQTGGTFSGYQVKNTTSSLNFRTAAKSKFGVPNLFILTPNIEKYVPENVPNRTAHANQNVIIASSNIIKTYSADDIHKLVLRDELRAEKAGGREVLNDKAKAFINDRPQRLLCKGI